MTEPGAGETVAVVVITMPLSKQARAELSEMLGPGYAVVDMRSAPSSANIVLTTVVSSHALSMLRDTFPQARILFTELHDDERGISFAGPLSRIVAQAPDGYFIAHSLDALTPVVQSEVKLQLSGSTGRTPLTLSLTSAVPAPQQETDVPSTSTVRWIDRMTFPSMPPGRWLDLEPIDALVVHMLRTDDPRRDPLWPALAAECIIRIAAHHPEDVLVDVAGLAPTTRAELQIRVESEQVNHAAWP